MSLATDFRSFLRRRLLIEMARQSALYTPTSHDDAAARLEQVAGALDAEILIAADAGEDDAVSALTTLRTAVVEDLTARGASLTPIRSFTVGSPLPADVLAQRLYRDPSRADELVAETGAVHPLFLPTTFSALAS